MTDEEFIVYVQENFPKEIKIGKLRTRLKGKAIEFLREIVYNRDEETCQECKKYCHFEERFENDPDAYDMAHIQSRGACGSDLPSNVRVLCHRCHMRSHGM